jgi:hypothetical protein
MLSFGSVAYDLSDPENPTEIGFFERNLLTLPDAKADTETALWWAEQPEAWEACRVDAADPLRSMHDYATWLDALPGKPIFVGYPASYDFMFVYWYLMKFVGRSPFRFQALDAKTYASAHLRVPFSQVGKKKMPKRWFDSKLKHTHRALDDAREQGVMFARMYADNLRAIR